MIFCRFVTTFVPSWKIPLKKNLLVIKDSFEETKLGGSWKCFIGFRLSKYQGCVPPSSLKSSTLDPLGDRCSSAWLVSPRVSHQPGLPHLWASVTQREKCSKWESYALVTVCAIGFAENLPKDYHESHHLTINHVPKVHKEVMKTPIFHTINHLKHIKVLACKGCCFTTWPFAVSTILASTQRSGQKIHDSRWSPGRSAHLGLVKALEETESAWTFCCSNAFHVFTYVLYIHILSSHYIRIWCHTIQVSKYKLHTQQIVGNIEGNGPQVLCWFSSRNGHVNDCSWLRNLAVSGCFGSHLIQPDEKTCKEQRSHHWMLRSAWKGMSFLECLRTRYGQE